ncbi:hypothetical protein M8J77_008354 [Diaphorina citri]|nr:hypothetical protein M8J77_008354 [Diaphorina citri]
MLLSQGRSLISGSNTLAAEFAAMSQDDSQVVDYTDSTSTAQHSDNIPAPGTKIKSALQEQQEVNSQLRSYIENILTMILEQQPELLEVKMKKPDAC